MPDLAYRPAGLDDAQLASDLMTAAYPAMPQDPVLKRYRWDHPSRSRTYSRFIAEMDGVPVAFLTCVHNPWKEPSERHSYVDVWLDRDRLEPGLLTTLWQWLGAVAEADGARVLHAHAGEDQPALIEVLEVLGYRRDRLEKVWELDLQAQGPRLLAEAEAARGRMSAAGIDLTTLTAWADPDRFTKLHALSELTIQDVPHSDPIPPQSLPEFIDRLNVPAWPHDRFWIALDKDKPVAMSYLRYPPVRGVVWTAYTCCHADYRRRGIARAVKLETLAQAIHLAVPVVCTDNDSENAPMLHINQTLGYQRRPGIVSLVKWP